MDQPGKVSNPARGQLNRENEYFPVRVRAWEFDLAKPVYLAVPSRVSLLISILRLNLLLTYGVSPEFRGGVYLIKIHHSHGVSPECIGLRSCVPMAFTAESPPAQGQ